ncbi:CBS domain-containing protein [Amycolatopsis thailandensis]|uniref:CBS domain-containing protein n=1 Tax=Amycolatopsis thailandensis TaxID=589330 RepID=A0A229RRZ5_9PSEU|nr:CBS domain-containing protein [Amycolatopsis thailandensis]OXM49437.1 CBS domain-containing protein [Amycolatopsis thailandensis]
MRARDLMTRPVVTVAPEMTAKHAAGLLTEHGFTALPVVNDDDHLIGIVTEADLIRDRFPEDIRSARHPAGQTTPGVTVAEVMTTPVTGMSAGADLADVGRALLDGKIRAMPIVDGAKVVGILTRGDFVRAFARADDAIAADVRHHLAIYGGPGRWTVEVQDGLVRIGDRYGNDTDHHVAKVIAEGIPGVVQAKVTYQEGEE